MLSQATPARLRPAWNASTLVDAPSPRQRVVVSANKENTRCTVSSRTASPAAKKSAAPRATTTKTLSRTTTPTRPSTRPATTTTAAAATTTTTTAAAATAAAAPTKTRALLAVRHPTRTTHVLVPATTPLVTPGTPYTAAKRHAFTVGSPTTQRRRELNQRLMDAIEQDVGRWIGRVIPTHYNSSGSLFDQLANGVILCMIFQQIVPKPALGRIKTVAPAGSFLARDNIAVFLKAFRASFGPQCDTFEVADLVEEKNHNAVIRCLLALSREGAKRGIAPPEVVQVEDEVDRAMVEQSASAEDLPPPESLASTAKVYRAVANDDIDKHLETLLAAHAEMVGRFTRITRGTYWLRMSNGSQRKIFLRILWNQVVVRVGGGWEDVLSYCLRHR